MKKLISIVTVILLLASCVIFAGAGSKTENLYALTTVVVTLESDTDTVVVEDATGHIWAFYGIEDWQLGDGASLLMSDSGTENICDDEILSARYTSFTITNNQ